MRHLLLLFFVLIAVRNNAQSPLMIECGTKGVLTRAVDMEVLDDGSFICMLTEMDMRYPPFNSSTFLLHLSPKGDSLERLNIGNPVTHIIYSFFFRKGDSILIQALTAPDSVVPHYSRKGAYLTTFQIKGYPLHLDLIKTDTIETAFSVTSQHFKALNWYYSPDLGYDAEICRLESDSGSGYKISIPGAVTIEQIIETDDGGVLALGEASYSNQGWNTDLYVLRLDKNLHLIWEKTYGVTKNQKPPAHVKPNSEKPTYFITNKIENGDTIQAVEFRMVADTITGHSTELFKSGYVQKNGNIILLGSVYGYHIGESYFLTSIDSNGEILWQHYSCDSVVDSLYYYSAGTHLVPLRGNKCMIVGYRANQSDPLHREMFTMTFKANGKIKDQSAFALENKWINPGKVIYRRSAGYIFADHLDGLRNGTFVPFIVKLDKQGRIVQ